MNLSLLSPALNPLSEWFSALSLYQIVVIISALIAAAMAAEEWRHNDNRDCRRLTLVFGAIGILHFCASLPLPDPSMPSLAPFVESVSLILVFWAFTRLQFDNPERGGQVSLGLLLLVLLGEAATWGDWLFAPAGRPWMQYADHWSMILWYLFQVGLAGLGLWLLLARRNEQRPVLAPAFGLVMLGNGAALFGYAALLEPLAGLTYILWTMTTYVMIVADLRSFGQELRALSERSLRHVSEQALLMEISRAAAESLDQSHILQVITDQSGLAFDADRLVLLLSEDIEAGRLRVMARYTALTDTRADSLQSHIYLRDAALLKTVMRRKRQLILSPAGDAGQSQDLVAIEHLLGIEGLTHAMLEPLMAQEEVIGLLVAVRGPGRPAFSAEESRLLTAMAALLTSALQNARLYAGLERANQDLSRLNAELRAAYEQLQGVDKLKSSFIGVITHELRSPFVDLDLSLQLLRRYGQEGWSAEQREQVAQLEQGIGRARRMVDSLVSFASLLSRQGALRLSRFDFAELAGATTAALAGMAASRNVQMEAQAGAAGPLWIEGDRARLAEALHHLLHNAIKFNRAGGRVELRYWADETHLACEVEDTGVGIPPDKLEGIWGQFTQAADPFRRGVEGLGLGLALVKMIVEAHGGRVAAQSAAGAGSSFGFQIPLTQRPTDA